MTRPISAHGPGAVAVAYNVKRRRAELDLSGTQLRERLSDFGLEVHRGWVSEVENRKRTVDVDELLCLAAALTVSPATLLMPRAVTPEDVVPTVSGPRDARDVWDWIVADRSLGSSWIDADDEAERRRYRAVARPAWVAFAESSDK
ncbi:helix-turn-helix domain-containing protein [Mycobacteroides chelonae]|uniref:helix-turn-helix domain-containing protein n=1 Tax=Mycobacteroides chelonae TaxID=1774 RepID=UPI0009931E3D|nr:helix-turn-helix transcriptional regulator [Mycobacteroides chelonae]